MPRTEQGLTPKQERFCQEYMIDLNGTQAALRCGYAEGSARQQASELMANPNIRARVSELMKEREEITKVNAQWVITRLVRNYNRCGQQEAVTEWNFEKKCFEETGEWRFDSTGANRSLELLGKHAGMFVERAETKITTESTEAAQLAAVLTPEELELIRQRIVTK